MKKKGQSIGAIIIAILALLAFLAASDTATAKVYQWKWYSPYTLAISPTMDKLPPLIEKKTGGQIKVTLYGGGQHPFQGPDMPRALKTGACQMGDVLGAYCVGIDPRLGAADMPFFSNNPEEEEALIASVLKDAYDKFSNDYDMMPLVAEKKSTSSEKRAASSWPKRRNSLFWENCLSIRKWSGTGIQEA